MLARILPYALFSIVYYLCHLTSLSPSWRIIPAYLAAAICLLLFRKHYSELHIIPLSGPSWVLGILLGTVGIAIWIVPYHIWPDLHQMDNFFGLMGKPRPGVNPINLDSTASAFTYIISRCLGYVLVTPVFEELFIRSFLMRFLIGQRFETVPIGAYTPLSFWLSAVFFALSHPEWIVALCYAVLFNAVLCKTKNFTICVVAHSTSNLLLIIYTFISGNWIMW